MNCLCNLFDDPVVWLIIIALILLFMGCSNTTNCSNGGTGRYGGCGCNN